MVYILCRAFGFYVSSIKRKTYVLLAALIKFDVRRRNILSLTWHQDTPPPLSSLNTLSYYLKHVNVDIQRSHSYLQRSVDN